MQNFFQPSSMFRAELMQKNIFSQRVCEELKLSGTKESNRAFKPSSMHKIDAERDRNT
jgi:hypothetical protein